MQAKEMMLNNLVIANGVCARITEIRGEVVKTNRTIGNIPVRGLSGIPLTPDILEKAGFVKDANKYTVGGFLHIWYGHDSWTAAIWSTGMQIPEPPQYLHTLQNLYFALTATKLNIEL